jgi:chemotaxis protein methyltransferase CheR
MKNKLSKIVITDLRKYLLAHLGLNFSEKRETELIQKLKPAAKGFGFKDVSEFAQWLLRNGLSNKQLEILASYLTIGETYFIREKKSFDFLEKSYLPSIIQKRTGKNKQLRIWSAGCASGEEAYSIAITLLKIIPNIKDWNITILATDINPDMLKKAKKGIYTKWSFRNNPDWFISKYFQKVEGNLFQILPEIKNMVTFSPLNLAKDIYPSLLNNTNAMDIIFCRNVLIYFSQEGIRDVTNRLYKSLLPDGVLIVSPVEMSNLISPKFAKINYEGYTIYQKGLIKDTKESLKKNQLQKLTDKYKSIQSTFNQSVKKRVISNKPIKEIEIEMNSNYKQAIILFEQGLFEQTENLLSKLLADDKENHKQIISLLAKTKANLGKLEEARLLCDKGLEIDKTDYSLYYLNATVKQEQGNDEEAISSLRRAIYFDHNFVLAHFLLGNLSIKRGNIATGQKYINNAINILSNLDSDDIVPESDGLTVGRFTEIITALKI